MAGGPRTGTYPGSSAVAIGLARREAGLRYTKLDDDPAERPQRGYKPRRETQTHNRSDRGAERRRTTGAEGAVRSLHRSRKSLSQLLRSARHDSENSLSDGDQAGAPTGATSPRRPEGKSRICRLFRFGGPRTT